ncbi:uncharacterized protein LTR77_009309 [Saxophila tyrrhenica]|uniref:Uncharacterized protein n=1 Tax=Saxophila tyrrhenica TaxID=1690608 RepID=A0AAV9NZN8_9PEZI|nr:hypothetical protein LTR77_009309 [Saxophila tyrrhenica]
MIYLPALAFGLLALTRQVLGDNEVCFNDDPGHFGDTINPLAGPDLQNIISSIGNKQLINMGGDAVDRNGDFIVPAHHSLLIDYNTARVCFQNPQSFGDQTMTFAEAFAALSSFVSACRLDLETPVSGGGTAVGKDSSVGKTQMNIWIQNVHDGMTHDCLGNQPASHVSSFNLATINGQGVSGTTLEVMRSQFPDELKYAAAFGGVAGVASMAAVIQGVIVDPRPLAIELEIVATSTIEVVVTEADKVIDISAAAGRIGEIVKLLEADGVIATVEAEIALTTAEAIAAAASRFGASILGIFNGL